MKNLNDEASELCMAKGCSNAVLVSWEILEPQNLRTFTRPWETGGGRNQIAAEKEGLGDKKGEERGRGGKRRRTNGSPRETHLENGGGKSLPVLSSCYGCCLVLCMNYIWNSWNKRCTINAKFRNISLLSTKYMLRVKVCRSFGREPFMCQVNLFDINGIYS